MLSILLHNHSIPPEIALYALDVYYNQTYGFGGGGGGYGYGSYQVISKIINYNCN